MKTRSKDIGTAGETAVVRASILGGFEKAERLALRGAKDCGDVRLCEGVIVEVKAGHAAENASDAQIDVWLLDTERERRNAGAQVGVLVTKRKGVGAANADRWWAWIASDDALTINPEVLHVLDEAPRFTYAAVLRLLQSWGYA